MNVSILKSESDYFGVPNNLIFKTEKLDLNTPYDVKIENVLVEAALKSFAYFIHIQ